MIKGATPSEWATDVVNYINSEIRQGKDVSFVSADGIVLTITKNTAGKASFRNEVQDVGGTKRAMTDNEFIAKLRAETHIDELAQVSYRDKKVYADKKIIHLQKMVSSTKKPFLKMLMENIIKLDSLLGKMAT